MNALPDFLRPALTQALRMAKTHAVLLSGPAGLGQHELAQALAQAWLCEAHEPATPACGQCPSCHLVDQRSHPDLRWLLPAALRVELGIEDAPSEGKAKPSKEIRIDEVRAMLDFATSTSGRGAGKVVGIHPAEAMNTIAANALLKTLEEPGGRLRFVLSCADPDALLPTIRSRCQTLALTPPNAADAQAWLASQGLAGDDAQALLRLAAGRPGQALQWSRAGLNAAALQRLPEQAAQGDLSGFESLGAPALIDLLGRLAHDQLRRAHGQAPLYFDAERLPAPGTSARLQNWARDLRAARGKGEHPLIPGLWIEALAAQAAQGLRASRTEDSRQGSRDRR